MQEVRHYKLWINLSFTRHAICTKTWKCGSGVEDHEDHEDHEHARGSRIASNC